MFCGERTYICFLLDPWITRSCFPTFSIWNKKGWLCACGVRGSNVEPQFNIFTFWQSRRCRTEHHIPYCKSRIVIKKLDAFIRQSFFKRKSLHLILIIILQSRHFCLPSGMSCRRRSEFLKARRRRGPIIGFCFPATCQRFSF